VFEIIRQNMSNIFGPWSRNMCFVVLFKYVLRL